MTWREDTLPARLGGIPIRYRRVGTREGTKKVVHEYLGKRQATVETTGLETWRATIEAFLVGDNYLVSKQRLLNVITGEGPWEFIHPTKGPIMVEVEPVDLEETVSEQGLVRIGSLSLVQAGLAFPQIVEATPAKLASLAAAAATAMATTTRLTWLGKIDKILDSIVRGINKATARVGKVNSRIGAVTGDMASIAAALNNFSEQRSYLSQAPWQVMGGLFNIVMSAFNALGKYEVPHINKTVEEPEWGSVDAAKGAINDLATFETDASDVAQGAPEGGPQVLAAQEAHDEVQLQVQTMAFVGGASIAGELPYTSAKEAASMMTVLANGLAASIAAPGLPLAAFQALTELRTATIRHLLETQANLPRIIKVPVPSLPAGVLAYELYGDPDQATAIIRRNKIGRGVVSDGTVLEVAIDG